MTFKKIQQYVFFGLFVISGLAVAWMLRPYWYAIFWAAIIASIFYPVFTWLKKKTDHGALSAWLTILLVIVIVVIPVSVVLVLVAQQAYQLYLSLSEPGALDEWIRIIDDALAHPLVVQYVGDVDVTEQLTNWAQSFSTNAIGLISQWTSSTITAVVNILIMLYTLFYFFKDGEKLAERLMYVIPLGDKNEAVLFERFASTSKATLKGTILLGGLQGTLGGILFAVVGLPSAAFWGFIMIVMSIIPAIGSFIVWFPAAVYLLLTGQIWQAVVLFIGGTIIGMVDNILRPPLVGKDVQMHPSVILFSTLGGLAIFGLSGVVFGPILAAFFLAILEMYERKYKKQLSSKSS